MGYNAIEIDGEMKLDLSEDTVTEDTLPEGVTAHDATGEPIVGKMKFVESVNGKNGKVTLDAADVGADKAGTAATAVSEHNVQTDAHNDIRLELQRLAGIINDILDSDDPTLDEMHEVVAYIKSNKTLIEAITDSKVNVVDIIDNLATNVANKPLSAAQGVALNAAINEVAGKTVNRISNFGFDSGETYYVSPTDFGIYWENDETEIKVVDKEGNIDFYYPSSSNCVPIVAGTNVSFTVDDQNKVVEINSTGHPPVVATSGSGSAYTARVDGLNSLYSGLEVTIIPHVNNTVTYPMLNLNGLGAKTIIRGTSGTNNGVASFGMGQIVSGKPLRLMYKGSSWIAVDHSKPIVDDLEGIVTLLPLLLQAGHIPEEIYDTSNHIYRTMYNPLDYTCQFGGGIYDISDFVSIGITSSSDECTVTALNWTYLGCEVLIEVRGSYDNNSMTWSDIVALSPGDDKSIDYTMPGGAGQYSWNCSLLGVRLYLY